MTHRAAIDHLIGERIATAPRAHWQHILQSAGIPVASTQNTAEIVAHEQTRALRILGTPTPDEIPLVGLPLSFDGKRPHPSPPRAPSARTITCWSRC
ncbi:CoA transferase [Nocardia sp. NPDC003482]